MATLFRVAILVAFGDAGGAPFDAGEAPVPLSEPTTLRPHLLTFDVEEYFQVEAAAARLPIGAWDRWPKRLPLVVDRLLDLLAARRLRATFFVLAWVAEHETDLVRRIAAAGHEIASHGCQHHMLGRLTPEGFRQDLRDSRRRLEDLAGRPVCGYRAPTFSLTHRTAWALDVLAEEGFEYDSSVFPIRHDRYGVPDAPRVAHRAVGPGGGTILEIPPLTVRFAGANWPIGGGGYLRLLPAGWVVAALRALDRRGQRGMIYLHPWELDPGQPLLPMSALSSWRHRVNLVHTEAKLCRLLDRFPFTAVDACLDALRAEATTTFRYGPAAAPQPPEPRA
jgi:polysaccharide deacetylase family protein (PEP-CTERM system associated)